MRIVSGNSITEATPFSFNLIIPIIKRNLWTVASIRLYIFSNRTGSTLTSYRTHICKSYTAIEEAWNDSSTETRLPPVGLDWYLNSSEYRL